MEIPKRSFIQYLGTSYEFALAIGNSLNLAEMLHEVIHTVVHKTNAHRGIIWVKDGEKKLQPVASAGINTENIPAQDRIMDFQNVFNQILKRQQYLLRCKEDKDFLQYCSVLTGKEESVLIVPVENVALLHLIYAGREPVDKTLANLLASLSRKLSIAIEACTAHGNIIKEIQVREKAEKELTEKTEQLISSQKKLQGLYGESEQARKSLLSILEDVAQKEEALKKTTKLLQSVMDNATDEAIITTDQMGLILNWNEGGKRLLGYESEEVVGRESIRIFHTEEYLKSGIMDVNTKKMIATRKPLTKELDYVTKDGKTIPVQEIVSPRFDEDGKFIGMVGMARDITERKLAQEERRKMRTQLQRAQKMEAIGTLAGGVAHDFNNILYSMIGYAELTMDDVPEGSVAQKNLQEIRKAGNRAKDVVQQILDFSRQSEHERKFFRIQPIIEEALGLLRSSIPTTIKISQSIDKESGAIQADPTQIYQVLMNLCTNAHHAMREKGGVLEVTLLEKEIGPDDSEFNPDLLPGTYLKLTVSDTGHGMNHSVIEKIFDPYFTTKPFGEGTGLGLAISHGIVKSCGGGIQVYSKPGEGTTFHVYLPLIEESDYAKQSISTEP